MFTLRVRDPLVGRGVSCVKLPAAVAFPIDSQLLDRLEQSRRALPPNSVKALWKSRVLERTPAQPLGTQAARSGDAAHATIEQLPVRVESRLRHIVRIEQLYARSQVALGQR